MSNVSPVLNDVYTALGNFIQSVVGQSVEVVQGLGNRVPMPAAPFIAMTAILQTRLATNVDNYTDPYIVSGFTFTGTASAVGALMTVSVVATGALSVGDLVGGANVPYGTTITSFGTGTGGVGTYNLSTVGGFVSTAITVTDGSQQSEQDAQLTVQLDCYGPNSNAWATMLSTLLRDDVGCIALAPNCQPLYCDDPRMMPLIDAEQQYEQRWMCDAQIQYNPVTSTGQQFAGAATLTVVNVDETYPP